LIHLYRQGLYGRLEVVPIVVASWLSNLVQLLGVVLSSWCL